MDLTTSVFDGQKGVEVKDIVFFYSKKSAHSKRRGCLVISQWAKSLKNSMKERFFC